MCIYIYIYIYFITLSSSRFFVVGRIETMLAEIMLADLRARAARVCWCSNSINSCNASSNSNEMVIVIVMIAVRQQCCLLRRASFYIIVV